MLETVDADANRVTRLIAELLDISRIDSGRLEVRRQPVDIGAAVRPAHPGATSPPASPPTGSCCASNSRCPPLWADPDKIDQVLGNLLENAVRHGEGTVTIDVTPAASPRERGRRDRHVGHRERRGRRHPGGVHEPRLHPLLAGQQARRHGPGPVHRQGHRRGPRRHHHGRPRPGGGAEFRFTLPVGTPAYLHAETTARSPGPPGAFDPPRPLDSAFGTFVSRRDGRPPSRDGDLRQPIGSTGRDVGTE